MPTSLGNNFWDTLGEAIKWGGDEYENHCDRMIGDADDSDVDDDDDLTGAYEEAANKVMESVMSDLGSGSSHTEAALALASVTSTGTAT